MDLSKLISFKKTPIQPKTPSPPKNPKVKKPSGPKQSIKLNQKQYIGIGLLVAGFLLVAVAILTW